MSSRVHLPQLDSVRGLAAFVVFVVHFAGGYGPFLFRLRKTPLSIFVDAEAAVSMFFVLSGFVLSLNSFQHMSLSGFYVKRFFRINVPFFAVLCVSLALLQIAGPSQESAPPASRWLMDLWRTGRDTSLQELVQQAALLVPQVRQTLVPQAWTLVIELKMSLLVPFLILMTARSSWWLLAFSAAFIGIFDGTIYLVHFAVGIALARHHSRLATLSRRLPLAAKAAILAVGLLLMTLQHPFLELQQGLSSRANLGWMAIGCGAWLFVLSGSAWADRVLCLPALRFLGRVSYSFFILHVTVLMTATPFVVAGLNRIGVAGLAAYAASFVASFALALGFSFVTYSLFEKPAIRAGRSLAGRLERRPARTA
jgi:peptidoglycan/LPS O-acetylase OafA/YrhL